MVICGGGWVVKVAKQTVGRVSDWGAADLGRSIQLRTYRRTG